MITQVHNLCTSANFCYMPTEILLYRDATIRLPLSEIANGLNRVMDACRISLGAELVEIPGSVVSLGSYDHLPRGFIEEAERADIVVVATDKRYDNNFFYHYSGKVAIISFAGWELLTRLPRTNGLVLMLAEVLVDLINLGRSHEDRSRGCVNDFRAKKTDIDFGLRAAFVCEDCTTDFERTRPDDARRRIFEDIRRILDDVSAASRTHSDIVDYWQRKLAKPVSADAVYDVFLCHNSREKEEIRKLNELLKRERVQTWFGEDQLAPGRPWQPELERQIKNVKSAAVIVGSSGRGPWQEVEIRAFLSEFVNRSCPIIPVLLETCTTPPELPLFLSQFTWADFRQRVPDPWKRLLWGIRGTMPSV